MKLKKPFDVRNCPMMIKPMNPIKFTSLGIVQEPSKYFVSNDVGYLTVMGKTNIRKNLEKGQNLVSRDLNSTIGDEISPRQTVSKESMVDDAHRHYVFNIKETN